MSSLERVDCIFQFFGESPQFAVIENTLATYASNVLILTTLLIFLLSTILFSVLKASIAIIFLRLMSFSVSSRLPSNLHFFHFSLPCRIISYSSVLDALITRLRFARVDGIVDPFDI